MKRLAAAFVLSHITTALLAQPQILNSGFETWQNVGTGTEEPDEWSSIKTSDGGTTINNFAPQVCWRSDDAHTGDHSVNVRTVNSLIGAANGIVTCGRVHAEFDPVNGRVFTDANDPQWHQVMNDRPDSLVGWYKTTVQTGDHPRVEAIVHSGAASMPENGTLANWVGRARFDAPSITLGEWTRFSVPFDYFTGDAPSYLLMVMSSGDSLLSQVGTQTWYDDVALIYNVACVPGSSTVMVGSTWDGSLDVSYSTNGTPEGMVQFTVELSDASGDFASPVIIGSLSSDQAVGIIPCTIPAGTESGMGYSIRIVSDSPYYAPIGCGIAIDLTTGIGVATNGQPLVHAAPYGLVVEGAEAGTTYACFDAQGKCMLAGSLGTDPGVIDLNGASGLLNVVLRHGGAQWTWRVLSLP